MASEKVKALNIHELNSQELKEAAEEILRRMVQLGTAQMANGAVRCKWESGKSEFTLRGAVKKLDVFE